MHTTHCRHRPHADRSRERGVALVFVTFATAALLVALTGALVTGTSNSQATSNYKGTTQVHFAAESALSEAVQRINAAGIVNFQNDVIDDWSNRWGTAWKPAPLSGFTYTVTPVANLADPKMRGRLVARAVGPNNLGNTVVAEVQRTNSLTTAPGAVYLANEDPVNPDFSGNTFWLDGNDHLLGGGAGPGAPVPGLSTRNQTNTTDVVNELTQSGGAQLDNIQGLGYQASSPPVPSVMTSPWAPSISQMNDFIDDLLTYPHTTLIDSTITGNMTIGTQVTPQLTYSTGSVVVKAAGSASGAGLWIIDGDLTIQGDFNYAGLIIVRGKTIVQNDPGALLYGNAVVYGSLWSQDVNFSAGGTSQVNYSTEGLALADHVVPNNALPTTIKVLSMADCAAVYPGSNGCPS